MQVARLAGGRHASPDARTQVHHHAAGGGHRLPGDGHQPAGRCGLGDDAVVFQPPLHARPGETGEVRRPPAVLRRRAAHRHPQAGRELCLPLGAQWQPTAAHLGSHAALHPRRGGGRHHEQRLPGVRHLHRTSVCRQWQPGDQRHHLHVLRERSGVNGSHSHTRTTDITTETHCRISLGNREVLSSPSVSFCSDRDSCGVGGTAG